MSDDLRIEPHEATDDDVVVVPGEPTMSVEDSRSEYLDKLGRDAHQPAILKPAHWVPPTLDMTEVITDTVTFKRGTDPAEWADDGLKRLIEQLWMAADAAHHAQEWILAGVKIPQRNVQAERIKTACVALRQMLEEIGG